VPHDTRDAVVDFVRDFCALTELPAERVVGWVGVARGKFYDWRKRYGKANEHNGVVPRDRGPCGERSKRALPAARRERGITDEERGRIIAFHDQFPLEGFRADRHRSEGGPKRRLTFMMLDRWNKRPTKKGTGFVQPLRPHEHWHVDLAYLNLAGTFHYLCTALDGASRAVVHWELRKHMTETDVECVLQAAREKHPDARPRIISDNGPQFIAKDFKEFIRLAGMTHVRTSPYYPQSNGKVERWHKTLKGDAIRTASPQSPDEARVVVGRYVDHYNGVRLHSAIGYVTPDDVLADRAAAIFAERDRKLEAARELRRLRRAAVVIAEATA
jgi:transposase InsO family protein